MPPRVTRKKISNRSRSTRKNTGGIVVTVEFPKDVAKCENALKNGLRSLVLMKAKWCGACHQFNDNVWSSLVKTRNPTMNLISIDETVAKDTSLASVPKDFFPKILLVGKDGKPATFKDEEGNSTNAMPRSSNDKEVLSALIKTPDPSSVMTNSTKSNGKMFNSTRSLRRTNANERGTPRSYKNRSLNKSTSPRRANRTPTNSRNEKVSSLAKSPFKQTMIPSLVESTNEKAQVNRTVRVEPINGRAPSVVEDLVSSQAKDKPIAMRGGKMLRAILEKTAALKAMLTQSRKHTRRHGRR